MRPLRSFLFLLIFLACFAGLHYLIPQSHLFPSVREIASLHHAGNSKSGNNAVNLPDSDTTVSLKRPSGDSIPVKSQLQPAGEKKNVNPLQGVLDSLAYSKGQVRILYYGDSQIEGDRVTSFLRQTLRKKTGGTGPGLFLPVMPVVYTKSLWITSSSNWKRYNYLSYKNGELSHHKLGPFMAICRYLPENTVSEDPEKATIKIKASNVADSASSVFDVLRIFYENKDGNVKVIVRGDGEKLYADTLIRGSGYNEMQCQLYKPKEIEIEFDGKSSPDIYGISIESRSGVIVDNIPQRGSAGLEFTMVDRDNLEKAYRRLNPDLIVLHYGLNIVKNIQNDYNYYQKGLERQIALLKEISPLTPVLVIGVTDMAFSDGDSIKSYTNIPAIVDAQKNASLSENVAFWDSYKAMGGRSSIITWAQKKPPLAQKDYVHFTYTGADTLSSLLAASEFKSLKDTGAHIVPPKPHVVNAAGPLVAEPENNKAGQENIIKSIASSILRYSPDRPLIFTTAAFWIFFLLVLIGYSVVYKRRTLRNIYLFLVSLFFYYKAGGLFLFILIFVTIIDYTCGFLIYKSKRKAGKRFFVIVSLISNIGLLGYFKYTAFIITTLNGILGTDYKVIDYLSAFSNSVLGTSFDISYIILPVGISFFTFQSLSYAIDVYRSKMEPVKNIIDFGFYVSFFPHLVAGPIVRASVFIPQIYKDFRLSKPEFSHALYMITKGLIKKIVISNFIALNLVDRVFDAPSIYSGFENLLAIYGYGLQIYCDFSGYTDIAIGVALILGFRLPLNFNSPYKADSIADFWRRWHISLSQWLRDYLYISLGGNRKGKIRTYFNLMITMLLGGLWHGASLKFMIWGGLHGIGLVINKIWNSLFRRPQKERWIFKVLGIFLTFQFVNFCWIFFRAPDMNSVKVMLQQIFGNFSPGSYMTVLPAYGSALLLMLVAYVIHFLPEWIKESYRGLFIKTPVAFQFVIVFLVAIVLYQMRTTEVIPFIYFRF
jgi:alginate O-acetyltransferase complex protein AlgI